MTDIKKFPEDRALDDKRDGKQAGAERNESARPTVSFDTVRVVHHSIRLGDNPSVSVGLPIALGCILGSETFALDVYEEERAKAGVTNQPPKRLGKDRRHALVRMNNHSRSSMVDVLKEVRHIQLSRITTIIVDSQQQAAVDLETERRRTACV